MIARTRILALGSLILLATGGHAAAVDLCPSADDAAAPCALDLGDAWQHADAQDLPAHRRRPAFVEAATLTVDGERVAVAVLEIAPWGSVGEDVDPGYDRDALARWVRDSATALAGQPGLELVDSGLVERDPPLGWIELLRTDAGLVRELGLTAPDPGASQPRIRQLQVVGAAEAGLVQVFVYLPEAAGRLRTRLFDETLSTLDFPPRVAPPEPEREGHDLFFIGLVIAACALVLLVGVRIYLTLQRRRLRAESNALGRTTTAPGGERPDGETPRAAWEDEQ